MKFLGRVDYHTILSKGNKEDQPLESLMHDLHISQGSENYFFLLNCFTKHNLTKMFC